MSTLALIRHFSAKRHNLLNHGLSLDPPTPRQNVEHYMRFKDQMKVGADGQKRLRLVKNED